MVFDVWTSQAAFDKFGKTLMPILQQLGIDPGQPSVMPYIGDHAGGEGRVAQEARESGFGTPEEALTPQPPGANG
jgi:hypothetical protein